MISRAFVLSFVTLATTSLLFSPSASAVEIMAKEAEGDRTETPVTRCSDGGSDYPCPSLRKDSVSATGNTASLTSLLEGSIEGISNKKNTKAACNDEDRSGIVCPPVADDAETTTSQ